MWLICTSGFFKKLKLQFFWKNFQKAEIARAASAMITITNNIHEKIYREEVTILLQTWSEHLARTSHFIYWLADEDQIIILENQGSFAHKIMKERFQ